jgi:hypothetical protein
MKSKGPFYVGKLRYWHRKALPITEVGSTQETEYPYRIGKCLVFRAPFTESGYYLGVFYKRPDIHPDDDEAIDALLSGAMKGRSAWRPEDGLYDEIFVASEDHLG